MTSEKKSSKYLWVLFGLDLFFCMFSNDVFGSFYLTAINVLGFIKVIDLYKTWKLKSHLIRNRVWFKNKIINKKIKSIFIVLVPAIFLFQGQVSCSCNSVFLMLLSIFVFTFVVFEMLLVFFFISSFLSLKKIVKKHQKLIYDNLNNNILEFIKTEGVLSVLILLLVLNDLESSHIKNEEIEEKNIIANFNKTKFIILQKTSTISGDTFSN